MVVLMFLVIFIDSPYNFFEVSIIILAIICTVMIIFSNNIINIIASLVKNISDSYKHIPYTLRHRKKLLELQKEIMGKKTYYFHDLDKVLMYILFPYIGTKNIHKIHSKLSKHHVGYFRGINKVDKKQAILDWESARFTKPDKPQNAAETLLNKYPQYLDDFSGYFYILGLEKQLEELLWPTNS